MGNIFDTNVMLQFIDRINQLTPNTKGKWGKMTVEKMLAHCNVTYQMVYDNNYQKPNNFKKLLLKLFVKNAVVGQKPYKKNGQTAPEFIIKDPKNFEVEKKRLIDYLTQTQQLGENYFDGKESHSFGVLTKEEWNILFTKHLDHHLVQFGV